jgi:Holliday junction resolvase RusA-like endonuclease
MNDFERLEVVLAALGADVTTVRHAVMVGEPHRKMRPKFGRRGRHHVTYQPQEDVLAEARTASFLRRAFPPALQGNVALAAIFYRSDRQVIDTDNLIKHVCDSGNGILFVDDSQATATAGIIELDADNPRTVMAIARHVSSMKRGADNVTVCQVCATVFSLEGKPVGQRNCSSACAARARRKDFVPVQYTHGWEDAIHGSA